MLLLGFFLGVAATILAWWWVQLAAARRSPLLLIMAPRWMARRVITEAIIMREVKAIIARQEKSDESS